MKKRVFALIAIFILLPLALAATQEEKQQYRACNTDCTDSKKLSQDQCKTEFSQCKENCRDNKCISTCSKQRINCTEQVNSDYKNCKSQCKEILTPKCIYNNRTYVAKEEFQEGCNICECKTSGKVSCKKEAFCNKNPEVEESLCTQSGGFFQALCNGPYFHMSCTQNKYCQCGGTYNYSCPENHECLTNFIPPKLGNYVPSYRNLNGQPLGNIGVCVN